MTTPHEPPVDGGHRPTDPTTTARVLAVARSAREADAELARVQAEAPDVVLVADYTLGLLSPEARAEVERRLTTDDAFQAMAGPLVQLPAIVRQQHEAEVDRWSAYADDAWDRLRDLEAADRADAASRNDPRPRAPAAVPGGRRPAAPVVVRSRWRTVGIIGLSTLGLALFWISVVYVLSLAGPWSPLLPAWRVEQESALTTNAKFQLGDGLEVQAMGPYFIGIPTPGQIGGGTYGRNKSLYIDSPFFSVTSNSSTQRELVVTTPRFVARGGRGILISRDEGRCDTIVRTTGENTALESRGAVSQRVVLYSGEEVRIACDGTLGKPQQPGALPPASGMRRPAEPAPTAPAPSTPSLGGPPTPKGARP